MDLELIDYELGFNIDMLGLDKAQRLQVGASSMTHAMVLTAVHIDGDGKPVRWRVQNSWGEDVGSKGFFVMSDRWMDEFVYQAVIVSDFRISHILPPFLFCFERMLACKGRKGYWLLTLPFLPPSLHLTRRVADFRCCRTPASYPRMLGMF